MRTFLAVSVLVLGSGALRSQVPPGSVTPAPTAPPPTPAPESAPTHAAQIDRGDIGFSYRLPAGWEFVPPPSVPKPVMPYPALAPAAKGDACVEVALTAKHGSPASVVVVTALAFACYGQTLTVNDLANFGEGASEGMKQTFDLAAPEETTYSLGSHTLWIERATEKPKNDAASRFTFEIACTVLEKGAVCWMTVAADAASLSEFEQSQVSFDGEPPMALIPATVFAPNNHS